MIESLIFFIEELSVGKHMGKEYQKFVGITISCGDAILEWSGKSEKMNC